MRLWAITLCAGFASPALAVPTFSVTFNDPTGTYAPHHDAIRANLLAAADDWGQYLLGDPPNYYDDSSSLAAIELGVDFNTTPGGRAGGGSQTSVYRYSDGGFDVFEESVAYEIRTGTDPNGATRDGRITISADYLTSELWFDPTPANRADESVPANKTDAYTVFLHELGHVLAFNGWRDPATAQPTGTALSLFDANIDLDGQGTPQFHGAGGYQLYGGPVPLTHGNLYHLGNSVASGRAGAELVPDLMNGVVFERGQRYFISPLDLALLSDVDTRVAGMGDATANGVVDMEDLVVLAAHYGTIGDARWSQGDFDFDRDVDLSDLAALAAHYTGGSAEAYAAFAGLTNVPEPSAIGLLAMLLVRIKKPLSSTA